MPATRSKKTPTRKASKATAKPAQQAAPTPVVPEPERNLATLQQELAQLEQRRIELERMIVVTRRSDLRSFCSEVTALIKKRGHDLGDVVDELTRRYNRSVSPRASRSGRATVEVERSVMAYNEDPSYTYVRGVTPEWMKEKMREVGLDPASSADRRRFRNEHMHAVVQEDDEPPYEPESAAA